MGGKFCLNTSLHNVSIGCVLYECQQGICIDCRGQINSVVLQTRAASNISSSNPNLPSGSLGLAAVYLFAPFWVITMKQRVMENALVPGPLYALKGVHS